MVKAVSSTKIVVHCITPFQIVCRTWRHLEQTKFACGINELADVLSLDEMN